ncbi:hypothetical protein F7725_015018 [Dissostichus mawsoni]|uniref:Uncharacterized protein n=1 Tax=Dissostichus mawsoni TaxID=36200 RepID=A0A7J5YHT1_DISMA|nr:hypothetical protein F7725_015018 [Dissostichus mawsoni]
MCGSITWLQSSQTSILRVVILQEGSASPPPLNSSRITLQNCWTVFLHDGSHVSGLAALGLQPLSLRTIEPPSSSSSVLRTPR